MMLSEYLERNRITVAAASKALGYPHETVRRWAKGLSIPRPRAMGDVLKWSDGAVTPADWYPAVDAAVTEEAAS